MPALTTGDAAVVAALRKIDLDVQARLGQGSFGIVYKAYDHQLHVNVAVKALQMAKAKQTSSISGRTALDYEVSGAALHKAAVQRNVPGVLALLRQGEVDGYMVVVFELCAKGDIAALLSAGKRLSLRTGKRFFTAIAETLAGLHRAGVMHRDVKPANVLLTKDNEVRLADFGLALAMSGASDMVQRTPCGSQNYAAPELLRREPYSATVDVWALGCTLYEMMAGHSPWKDNGVAARRSVVKNILAARFTMPDSWPVPLRDLVRGMIHPDPTKRLTMEEVLQHPWVTESWTKEPSTRERTKKAPNPAPAATARRIGARVSSNESVNSDEGGRSAPADPFAGRTTGRSVLPSVAENSTTVPPPSPATAPNSSPTARHAESRHSKATTPKSSRRRLAPRNSSDESVDQSQSGEDESRSDDDLSGFELDEIVERFPEDDKRRVLSWVT